MSQSQYQRLLLSQYQEVQDAYSVGEDQVLSQNKVTFKNKAGEAGGQSTESQPGGSMGSLSKDQ